MWYWPWESWLLPKAAPPPTWSVFGPQGVAALPVWLGVPVLGGFAAASMLAPKLIQKDIDGKKAQAIFLAALSLIIIAAHLLWHLAWLQGFWLIFFGYLYFYFGLLLPQRHIRGLDWARYLVTMALVVSTMGILLKMGARLGFNIKYVLTLPAISMNI